MKIPHTTLEQWRVLQAIVEYGSFSKAAEALHRSQSSVSYMVANLQEQLGVDLLRIEGRRARLTDTGAELLRDASELVDSALKLEARALHLKQGWEPEIHFVVDGLFPRPLLTKALSEVAASCPQSRLQLKEVVMSGADEAIAGGEADVVISGGLPEGALGDPLMEVEFIAVASPTHPLHKLGRELSTEDLGPELQIVVRDSGTRNPRDDGWLGARRWTVSNGETKVALLKSGMGFGWQPLHTIEKELEEGSLKPLPLREGQRRKRTLYLVFPGQKKPGPGALKFAGILRECVSQYRSAANGAPSKALRR
jgi:DNA-binding transcriptional LysR family regulator